MFNFPTKIWVNSLAVGLLVFAVVFALYSRPLEPLSSLRYLGESAGRIVDRNMAFYEDYNETAGWEKSIHTFLFGSRKHVTQNAIAICRDVLGYFKRHPDESRSWVILNTRARLMILLAQSERWREFESIAVQMEANPEDDTVVGALRYSYGRAKYDRTLLELNYGVRLLPLGWSSQHVGFLVAERVGQHNRALFLKDMMLGNARDIRHKLRWVYMTVFLSIGVGMVVLVASGFFRRFKIWPDGVLQRPWPMTAGILIVLVSLPLALLLIAVLSMAEQYGFGQKLLSQWETPLFYMPMLALMYLLLLKPRGLGFRQGFGLGFRGMPVWQFPLLVLALLSVDWLGSTAIAFLGWQAGMDTSWVNSVHEPLLFGDNWDFASSGVDIVAWAPVFEELAYRGLVYVSLRSVFKASPAIIISALLFSFLHFYSLVGFLTVFWSGMVLAYSFERFRSLLPGMAVHALGNILFLMTVWLFYS